MHCSIILPTGLSGLVGRGKPMKSQFNWENQQKRETKVTLKDAVLRENPENFKK